MNAKLSRIRVKANQLSNSIALKLLKVTNMKELKFIKIIFVQ